MGDESMSVEIRAQRSVATRPIVAGLILAVVVMLSGAFLEAVDRMAFEMFLLPAVGAFLYCSARAAFWLAVAGRVVVTISEEQVVLVRGARTDVYRRSLVDSVRIESGEAWPEWSRWAVHPRVVIRLRDGRRNSRQILLSPERVSRTNRELSGVIPGSI